MHAFSFVAINEDEYDLLLDCACRDFGYGQTRDLLIEKHSSYLAEDQYNAFKQIVNAEISINIGHRRNEVPEE